MTPRQAGALLLLAAIWGASFLFIRIAAPILGPFPLMAGRVGIAAGALAMVAALRGVPIRIGPYWPRLLLLGLIHAAAPFTLIAVAELRLTASMTAVLIAAQPLFAAMIGGIWLEDQVSLRQALGLMLGMAGVGIVVGWSPAALQGSIGPSVAAALLAALCYAAGGIYARRRLSDAPVFTLALGQQLAAAAWLVVPALMTLPSASPASGALFAMIGLAVVCTALAYLIFFWLLEQTGPVKAYTVTYVIPVFGVLWGALFLGEAPTGGVMAGLSCVLVSLVLVNRKPGASTVPPLPRTAVPARS
jgi:drug/metabolite transporter (DMT)-like permease